MSTTSNAPRLRWDWGTGYDLFASLFAIYHPAQFGIRPAWAAGVRSRIPNPEREVFAASLPFMGVPVRWILDSEPPKDARAVLARVEALSADRVLPELALNPHTHEESDALLARISKMGTWTEEERARVADCHRKRTDERVDEGLLDQWLSCWTDPSEFGRRFAAGLSAYYENFFREEEGRIAESLAESVERGKTLAQTLAVSDLLEELTQGLDVESFLSCAEVVLIPSYWTTPLILYGEYSSDVMMVVYGARPKPFPLSRTTPGFAFSNCCMSPLGHRLRLPVPYGCVLRR
jgi:hypothetical protein